MSKVLSCHSQPDLFYYFSSSKYWQWKFLALFTTTTDLHSSVLLRSKSKSETLKMSTDTNDLGVWGKKEIQAHNKTYSWASGRANIETKTCVCCLKSSEARGKTFAQVCLNSLCFGLSDTFLWCCSALVMA